MNSEKKLSKGQIIAGKFGELIIRQKSDSKIEIGEILICYNKDSKSLLLVNDLYFGSQISQQNIEMISGMELEEGENVEFFDKELRNYTLVNAKNIITIDNKGPRLTKDLPDFFSNVYEVKSNDVNFLTKPKNPVFFGNLRSGCKVMDVSIYLNGKDVFSHHILIPASTGKGKSNLTSCILYDIIDKDYVGTLILDPHDEYYGRNGVGLKDHPSSDKVIYYTPNDPPVGGISLKINLKHLKPNHFNGVVSWSVPQKEALSLFYKKFGERWIEQIIINEGSIGGSFNEGTLNVVKRRIMNLLDLEFDGNQLTCNGIFSLNGGENTLNDICLKLEDACSVIIDTSFFSGAQEILIGSLVSNEIFSKYKYYKNKGVLDQKPVISIVIEEAPRVLGSEVLEKGSNIFSTIAREGRKFHVGLLAITQLPSLIPRQILANMNTKIILGIEMAPERVSIIESASQDLSSDNRNIASLDKGEAIVTSNFSKFAIPIKVPFFKEIVESGKKKKVGKSFSGIELSV